MADFPTAKDGDVVAVRGSVWNRLVQMVQRLSRISVAPPLTLSQGPEGIRISMIPAGGRMVPVKGTTNSGGGEYTGRILTGTSNATAGSNLSMPAGLDVPSADNALIINPAEDGSTGHALTVPFFSLGKVIGVTNDDKSIVLLPQGGGSGGPSAWLPVTLSQVGGTAGDKTHAASFTYNAVNGLTGASISGGPFSPAWNRPLGKTTAASNGMGFYPDGGTTFVLLNTDEAPVKGACSGT